MSAQLGLGGYFSNPIDHPPQIVKSAYEMGIRFFDTAPAYGQSEEWISEGLIGFSRGSYILSTKTKATNLGELLRDLSASAKKLRTDYIDILFGHDFVNSVDAWHAHQKVIDRMKWLKKQGQIVYVGVSGHSPEAAKLAIESKKVDYIMVPHSIAHRQFDKVIDMASKAGVKVITMKNFGSGILLGGPGSTNKFKDEIKLQHIVNFSAHYDGVEFIIPAARDIAQLQEINDAYVNSFKVSDEENEMILETIYEHLGDDFCRYCNICRPCEVHGWQMSQPGILKAHLYDKAFGLPMADTYAKFQLNVHNCEGCDSACSKLCPFEIDIKERMKEAHEYFKGGNSK